MAGIRHTEINNHLINSDQFEGALNTLVQLYNSCPDASRIRFVQAVEDLFKANSVARLRTEWRIGSGWRDEQKAEFAGRGKKWVKIPKNTGLGASVTVCLNLWERDGEDITEYMSNTDRAGFYWIRYSGPRGTAEQQNLGFEIRIHGAKEDHPQNIIQIPALMWTELNQDDHSVMVGTPHSLNLEV